MLRFVRRLSFFFLMLTALAGCRDEAPVSPAPGSFTWRTLTSPALGVSVRVPSVFEVAEQGNTLALRYDGTPARLILATPEEADRRGLWTHGTPGEAVRIDGREGHRVVYDHGDGPFFSHTIAYVFPHRGRQLGLEFRTDDDDLDAVQAEMLASLRFTK